MNFQMNRRALSKIMIAVIAVIAVAATAGGAYYLSTQNAPGTNPNPTPTPTASPTTSPNPTATSTPTATPTSAPNVADATSLQYTVTVTEGGVTQGTTTYSAKNVNTNSFKMRIDITDEDNDESSLIINQELEKAWSYSDGQWEDISLVYAGTLGIWKPAFQGYVNGLSAWSGIGDYTYTQEGVTVRIYNISVNPSLPDSLFEPT